MARPDEGVEKEVEELLSQDDSLDLLDEDCSFCDMPLDECVCDDAESVGDMARDIW